MKRLFQRRRLWLTTLIGVALLVSVFVMLMPTSRLEVLAQPPEARRPRFSFLGRWSTVVRSTGHRIKQKVFGPPRNVTISAQIFELDAAFALTHFINTSPAISNRAGLQVWLLETNELSRVQKFLQDRAKTIAQPSIWTADGLPARAFAGEMISVNGVQRPSGVAFDASARARGDSVDLTTFVTMTTTLFNSIPQPLGASIQTNFALGVRAQVPRGFSILFLATNNLNGNRLGAVVSPVIHEPGK